MVYLAPVSYVQRGSALISHWGFAWRHDLALLPALSGFLWCASTKDLAEGGAKSAPLLLGLEDADPHIVLQQCLPPCPALRSLCLA